MITVNMKNRIKDIAYYPAKVFVKVDSVLRPINILSIEKSINELNNSNKSLARFGDGEYTIMAKNGKIGFQDFNQGLKERLLEIISSDTNNCFIGVPHTLNELINLSPKTKKFWAIVSLRTRGFWVKKLIKNKVYLTTLVTRVYIDWDNRDKCGYQFEELKKIWNGKEIIIVEGEKSRLGVGNDLFDGAKSIERVLCPARNSFDKYEEIFRFVRNLDSRKLVLLALGPTATVLAYDLSMVGFRAIDIGHCDLEYEWYLKKAKGKVEVEGKYCNETYEINQMPDIADCNNTRYLRQIIKKIL